MNSITNKATLKYQWKQTMLFGWKRHPLGFLPLLSIGLQAFKDRAVLVKILSNATYIYMHKFNRTPLTYMQTLHMRSTGPFKTI